MTFRQQCFNIIPLVIVVLGLSTYSFMNAQWQGPGSEPPYSNIMAPINVGTSSESRQSAQGNLIFGRLIAEDSMWSPKYCNQLGQNCILQEDLNYLSGGASAEMDTKQVPPGGFLSISCPDSSNSTFNPTAVSTMTGGGCSRLNGGGDKISSYPSNWMGSNLPPAWHCQNTGTATTTMTVYAMCLDLYSVPPDFSGGA